MKQFDANPNNEYQSDEEQINGVGAHEEVHLTDDNMEKQKIKDKYQKSYQTELPAYKAEIIAREEWQRALKPYGM
jgi:transcription initiation factor TFIIIB Brf1 subunit/transcription initiation factor TFIIB